MDSKNAFNTLNCQELVQFRQKRCETHNPNLSPTGSNQCTDKPSPSLYCWDALCQNFAAEHAGHHCSLTALKVKYYSSGTALQLEVP
jgi:hypothetical protein